MSATNVFQKGATALISGGASGVGLALAKLCREKGMNVFVMDRDTAELKKTKSELEGVETFEGDVSKIEDWNRIREAITGKYGSVQLLSLNAGISMKGTWGEHDYFRDILEVNLFGIINGLNTFYPQMKEAASKEGAKNASIVITGSKQGITNPPGNPAYNASKAAVKSLAEQVSYDLKDTPRLTAHLLVPGWTFTGLVRKAMGVTEKPAGAWTPEQVVDFMYKKMEQGKFYIICPDNDVTEETDKKRIAWGAGDITEERPPLSRWREGYGP